MSGPAPDLAGAPYDPEELDIASRPEQAASISGHAARGFALTFGASLLVTVAQFASSIVLARLLLPSAYGLVAITYTFVSFAGLFNDLGLTSALVQSPRLTERDASTAFLINLVAGVVLTGGIILLREPLAHLFGQPRLAGLLAVASLAFVLSFTVVPFAILERRLRFGTVAAISLVTTLLGLVVSVVCAAEGVGAESLVIGPVTTTVLASVSAALCAGWVPRARPSRASARRLISYGGHLTGYNIVGFWARNADNLSIGRVAGAYQLGLYNRAYQLMQIPLGQIGGVLSRVLLPLLSNIRDDRPRMQQATIRICRMFALLLFPALVGLAAVAHDFVLAAFGVRWHGAIRLIVILSIAGIPQVFGVVAAQVCAAVGEARLLSTWGTVFSLTAIVAIGIGLPWGAEGVAIALAVRAWVTVPLEMIPAKRTVGVGTWELVRATRVPFLAAVAMGVVTEVVGLVLEHRTAAGVGLAAQVVVAAPLYLGLIVAVDRSTLDDALILVRARRPEAAAGS